MNPIFKLTTCIFLSVVTATGCVRVDPTTQRRATLDAVSVDQVLAIVIDTSGSFDKDWEGKAYPFLVDLIRSYFHQSLGSRCVLQIAVLSETGHPVFWIASPHDFNRAFPSERAFLDRLDAETQTRRSPIFRSVKTTIESVRATAGLRSNGKATVVVLSDLQDTTQPREDAQLAAKQLAKEIKSFADDGGNIAFYYADPDVAIPFRGALESNGVPSDRYWIESDNVFVPTPPNFY